MRIDEDVYDRRDKLPIAIYMLRIARCVVRQFRNGRLAVTSSNHPGSGLVELTYCIVR